MTDSKNQIAESLDSLQTHQEPILVQLSNELIHLLSDQLYQSPLKAIEELVVNSYDADASECFVYVPTPDDTSENQIVVFDNGAGMSYEGLVDLWHIGNSTKREKFYQEQRKRKQIGKFGIGKLATYTIADHLTYISKVDKVILAISINFNSFKKSQTGASEIVQSPVRKIDDLKKFLKESSLGEVLGKAKVDEDKLSQESWTIAILESLKEKAKKITEKRLLWILRTAMPLKSNFTLYLNGEEVTSSKDDFDAVVTFNLTDLPDTRLDALEKSTGETWERKDGKIVTPIFPNGISGEVIITEKTLHGKSDDLERSHGFFIRVLGRLVNETDSLFGLKPLEHGTFNRFRADIDVDDLDNSLKASREAVEESLAKEHFRKLLQEVFNEANRQYYRYLANKSANTGKTEGKKNFVLPNFVEVPIADVLTIRSYENGNSGSEADNSWFYLEDIPKKELNELIRNLYQGERKK
ncbi:MAG: ATP-binding protein, partial [Flavobacteriaceae bacterium]|nr:ATP-binding protein [Flavobacteriaceae bacterium]